MDPTNPRPLCPETNPVHNDPGTLIPGRSPTPGSTGRFVGAGAEQLWSRILNSCFPQPTQDKIGALATSLHSLELLSAESAAAEKADHLKRAAALKNPDAYAPYAEHLQARGQLIDAISGFRMAVTKLTPDELHVSAQEFTELEKLLSQKFRQFTPYYTQMANFNLLAGEGHEAWRRTCNLTSLGMALEGLALSPATVLGDQKSVDPKLLDKIAALRGLPSAASASRMPDFLEILAVYVVYEQHKWKSTPERVFQKHLRPARTTAAKHILTDDFLEAIAHKFGAKTEPGEIATVGAEKALLDEAQKGIKKMKKMWDTKDPTSHTSPTQRVLAAGSSPGRYDIDAALEQHNQESAKIEGSEQYQNLENTQATENKKISVLEKNRLAEIDRYKAQILSRVKPSLDQLAQVIVNKPGHFMKLNDIVPDGIVIDDPWIAGKKDHLTWDKAWEKGYFRRYIILTK
jgi:hypothetical protein